jgi:hypothetical protein
MDDSIVALFFGKYNRFPGFPFLFPAKSAAAPKNSAPHRETRQGAFFCIT